MKLIIKNPSSDQCSYISGNVIIPAAGELDVNYLHWFGLLLDLDFLRDLRNHNLVVNDGLKDMVHPESEEYLITLNQLNIANRDTDGSTIQRSKAARAGWKAQFHSIRITTAKTNGYINKSKNGTDLGFCTYVMYDSDDNPTETEGSAVKTVITWEPNYDMEIVGGKLLQKTPPPTDVWLWVTAAAHIPAQYGGNVEFTQGGLNLADVPAGATADFDGRVSKYIPYDSVNHSGRFEIVLSHGAGVQHSFTLVLGLFKP